MAHSRFYWLLPLTPLGWRRRASLTACCLPPRLPAWHSSVAIVETRGVSLGGQVDLLLLADAARTRLGGSGSTTCHGVTSRGIRTKSYQNVTFIQEQIKYHQFAFCCSFQSFLSDPFPSRSQLWFVLFAESAVPSDDDDMIGYDVGLRPQPPPPPPPRRRRPTVATVASNSRSFLVRLSWRRGILRLWLTVKGTRGMYTVSSLCPRTH